MDSTARAGSRATGAWNTVPGGARRMCKCLVPEEAFGCCWAQQHAGQNETLGSLWPQHSMVWRGKGKQEEWAEVRRELFMAPHFVGP